MTDLTPDAIVLALILFCLRVFNYSISTIRLVFIARGRRLLSAMLAFIEALIFAVVMASVVADLRNLANLLSYCMGAAVGSYVGMTLEAHLITSYSTINVVVSEHGKAIADALRAKGFGVTVTHGEGRDGQVDIIQSSANNRTVPLAMETIRAIHPDAFVQVQTTNTLQRGWIPGGPPRR